MAGAEAVVFHDFFGFVGTKNEEEKCRIHSAVVNSSKVSGTNLALSKETEQEVVLTTSHSTRQVEESGSPAILSGSLSLELQNSEEITSGSLNTEYLPAIAYSLNAGKTF